MHQRTRFHAYAVIPCLALGLMAQAPEPAPLAAPQGLASAAQPIQVATHASRWAYPRVVTPPAGTQLHIVVKGDTLWDLAAKYLGNPFAWPQIWELNKWVEDPHWIYPGDPILVDGSRSTMHQTRDQDMTASEVSNLQPDLKRVFKPTLDEYAYSFQDFIQMPYLAKGRGEDFLKKQGAVKIVGRQDGGKHMLGDGDIVYLDGGTKEGLKVGDRLVVSTILKRKFFHPNDSYHRKALGDIIQQRGVLRIVRMNAGLGVAVVERTLDGVLEGYFAVPFIEPANIVNHLRTDTGNPVAVQKPAAKIIFIREDRAVAGGSDMVILDQGSAQGYKVGEVLLLARERPMDEKVANGPRTNFYLGQLILVRCDENSSTGRLTRTKEEVIVGDLVTH